MPRPDGISERREHRLSLFQRLTFSVGHVLNDLCASMWFSYLLVYMHYINHFHNTTAGVLLLIGQTADAIATPFVGIESDKDHDWFLCKFGQRKTWHLFGTICVLFSFPFIFNRCISCENSFQQAQIVYYAAFIVIFQFGWASVQISHLSLIPDLTPYSHERIELNAWRYAFTVISSITVYIITWIVLQTGTDTNKDQLDDHDANKFRMIVLILMSIGFVFSLIFHIGVRENDHKMNLNNDTELIDCTSQPKHLKWKHWFRESQFYKVALLYMGTRLTVNLTQVYTPLYLQETLNLPKGSIAYIPLVIYFSGFISSFVMKYLNVRLGKKVTYLLGSAIALSACTWLYLDEKQTFQKYGIYLVAVLIGISGTTMLITSLAITNDLIGHNTRSGAFVFGAMSFVDKLSNGVAVIVIENLHPCTTCGCDISKNYYRNILAFVCGGATVLALIALALLARHKIGVKHPDEAFLSNEENNCDDKIIDQIDNSNSPLLTNEND